MGHYKKGGTRMNFKKLSLYTLILISKTLFCSESPKKWTLLVYMAADNDLHLFVDRNLEQMKQIGSNDFITILVHLDIHRPGQKKVTKRLVIYKNKAVQIGEDLCMDSGDEQTLIDALQWAHRDFPADYFAIAFWNHGSGDLNPTSGRTINPSQLFTYNSHTKMIELDRSIGFLEFIDASIKKKKQEYRGVCFDESTGNYLNDQKLKKSLEEIYKLRNKKIDLVFFDACLMAGMGTAYIVHPYAHYMVASEEAVLGTGADYSKILRPFNQESLTPEQFAAHIVDCYQKTYSKITNDYTQSAFNLEQFELLHKNINNLAILLLFSLQNQKNNSVKQLLRQSGNKLNCTYFDEPGYKDLMHFYTNVLKNISSFELINKNETQDIKEQIIALIHEGIVQIKQIVIANTAGKNLKHAGGISIYLPDKVLHSSYKLTEFAKNNCWLAFLEYYLSLN